MKQVGMEWASERRRIDRIAPLLSSERDDWCTPEWVVDLVERVAGARIALDPCCNRQSPLYGRSSNVCVLPHSNGLAEDWTRYGGMVYVNPPYGRALRTWLGRCADAGGRVPVVALVPSRTGAKWFQEYVLGRANAICYLRGRVTFVGAPAPAPFDTALAIWSRADRCTVDRFVQIAHAQGWTSYLEPPKAVPNNSTVTDDGMPIPARGVVGERATR